MNTETGSRSGTTCYARAALCLLGLVLILSACGAPSVTETLPPTEPVLQQATEQVAPTEVVEPAMGPPIRIGFVGVLSGPTALNGQLSRDGAILAIDEINAAGGVNVPGEGPRPFELMVEDDTGSPDTAISVVSRMVLQDEVFAILGPDFGNMVVATLQLCREHGYLQLYSTISSATSRPANSCETAFRNRSADVYWARALVDYLVDERGYTRIATSYANWEFGITGNNMVLGRLAEHGLQPVVSVSHEFGDTDLTPTAASIVQADAEVVIYWGLQDGGAILLQQLRNLGWQGVFAGPTVDAVFVNIAGDLANGAVGAQNWVYVAPDERSQAFAHAYEERFGIPPGSHAAGYYDAPYLLMDAIEHVGLSVGDVVEYIANLQAWEGLQGTFRPAELPRGELTSAVRVVVIENLIPVVVRAYE